MSTIMPISETTAACRWACSTTATWPLRIGLRGDSRRDSAAPAASAGRCFSATLAAAPGDRHGLPLHAAAADGGQRLERVRILTHYESDYAGPRWDARGQCGDRDRRRLRRPRWLGFEGKLPTVPSLPNLPHPVGPGKSTALGAAAGRGPRVPLDGRLREPLREVGYAVAKAGLGWLPVDREAACAGWQRDGAAMVVARLYLMAAGWRAARAALDPTGIRGRREGDCRCRVVARLYLMAAGWRAHARSGPRCLMGAGRRGASTAAVRTWSASGRRCGRAGLVAPSAYAAAVPM